jgi:hypothetical protein
MGKSERIRLRDVRQVFRLLGECCELGADPLVWRGHMLQHLGHIVGAQIGICGTVIPVKKGSPLTLLPESFVDVGWATDRERGLFLQWLSESPPDIDPLVRHMGETVPRKQASLTCSRREVISDDNWYKSPFYNEFYRPSRLDDRIESFFLAYPFAGDRWDLLNQAARGDAV